MSSDVTILTIVLIIVSWATCGALAILLTYLYYVIKVCQPDAVRMPGPCIKAGIEFCVGVGNKDF